MWPAALDPAVLKHAYQADRILITFDQDLARLVFRQRQRSHGLILLRFAPTSPQQAAQRTRTALRTVPQLRNRLIIVTETAVRSILLPTTTTKRKADR